jgi:hypothetical protein
VLLPRDWQRQLAIRTQTKARRSSWSQHFPAKIPALLGHGVRSISAESIADTDVQRPLDFARKYGLIDKSFDASALLAANVLAPHGR